jgi:thioredoxin-like negative regulator of GroEL
MIDADVDNFDELIREGPVLVDIWGPQCRPCLALMPAIEALAERYRGRVRVVKVKAPENRRICRDLRVAGLPAYLTMRDAVEVERLTSSATTPAEIEEAIERLLDGAPAVGPPVPEHLRDGRAASVAPTADPSAVRPSPPREGR